MGDRLTLARKLLDNYHSKALELLMDYLQDKEIRAATEQYIGQHDPSPVRLDMPLAQQSEPSGTRSHHLDSSLLHKSTRKSIPDARYGLPTPSNSAGSVKSHSSSLAAAGLERIYLISCDDDGADRPVLAKSAPGRHNLIRDKVAYGRGLGASPDPVDEMVLVHLPSGGQRYERVKAAVNLTWRRRNEFTTNVDVFYVVSATLFDSDVILGSEVSLESRVSLDVQDEHLPQASYQQAGFVAMEETDAPVRPPAPTVLIHPYQQTSRSPHIHQTYERVQAVRGMHHMNAVESPAPAAHPTHRDRDQPTHTTTTLAAQGPGSSQIQMHGLWDKTPIKLSFDPDTPGEAFYQAFHQWAVRRNRDGDLERQRMTLWLKRSKNTPDDEAYELGLKEGELEELWETAVEWIQENKSPKAPHLFATVQLEPG